MKLLVIEDFPLLRKSIAEGLREAGFTVDATGDGEEGYWFATTVQYDVIILDLMLPKIDGLTILKQLRQKHCKSSIIVLTAKDTVEDRIKGLNLGADDYLVKPFVFDELLARVRSMVRRKYEIRSPIIEIGDMQIDTTQRLVLRAGEKIELSRREYSLLELLASRTGQVVTRQQIWESIYELDSESDSNVVDVFIGHLRRKIEREGLPKLIHTRRGHGYVLGKEE